MELRIRATYENGKALPVGTQVELTGETRNGGYWNGNRHIKTGDSVWAIMHRGATPEQLADMVARRANDISPGPSSADGEWIILNPEFVFAELIASVGFERAARDRAESRERNARTALADVRAFVSGDEAWVRVEDES